MSSMSVQNWRRESGSTPVVGSSRMSRSGSWTSAPHSPTFCFIPPESLPAGRSANGPSPVASSSSLIAVLALRGGQPEQLRHEVDVVVDAELEVEVLAQALRHVRDPRAHGAAMPDVGDVAVEDGHAPLLHLLGAGDQRHQRRLADAVGADDADHEAAGNIERDAVERDDLAVAVGDVLDGDDRLAGRRSSAGRWRQRMDGHATASPGHSRLCAPAAPGASTIGFCSRAGQTADSIHLDVADAADARLDALDVLA